MMAGLRYPMRLAGCPEGPVEKRVCALGAGCALAVSVAGAGVGLLCWRARAPGELMAVRVLLGGYGAAFAAGAGVAAFGPVGIAPKGRLFRRVFDAVLVGQMSAVLCALGSILGVLAAAMREAWNVGAAEAVEQLGMLTLACLAALAGGCLCSGGIAVKRFRHGCKAPGEERGR